MLCLTTVILLVLVVVDAEQAEVLIKHAFRAKQQFRTAIPTATRCDVTDLLARPDKTVYFRG